MSKAQLKKTLTAMTHDEVVAAVLEAYSANPEIKGYFEFFLNPDIEAWRKKIDDAILKEMNRQKRGRSLARITKVRGFIKMFEAYGVGTSEVLRLYYDILRWACRSEVCYWLPERVERGYVRILEDLLKYADKNLVTSDALKELGNTFGKLHARSHLRYVFTQALTRMGLESCLQPSADKDTTS